MYTNIYTQTTLSGIPRGVIPSVGVVVIDHFSLDGELKDEQYCIPPMRNIFLSHCEEDLLKNIISKLSHDGQVVLDAVSENGMLLVNTFVVAVCIYHIQCVLSVFLRKIETATAYFLNLGDKYVIHFRGRIYIVKKHCILPKFRLLTGHFTLPNFRYQNYVPESRIEPAGQVTSYTS